MTYKKALEDIKKIVEEIENGDIDVDILEKKLIKAKELFTFCQQKLKTTKESVINTLNKENENNTQ